MPFVCRATLSAIHRQFPRHATTKDISKVIGLMEVHEEKHGKRYFYGMKKRRDRDICEAATRLVYLNKTCFNSLYRVNSKIEFNVPMGSHKNPQICDVENLNQVSKALHKSGAGMTEFNETGPHTGGLIYCEPQYDSTSDGYTPLRLTAGSRSCLPRKRGNGVLWTREWSSAIPILP